MSTEQILFHPSKTNSFYHIKKLMLAHDFSDAATSALEDAKELTSQFDAELLISHIEPSGLENHDGLNSRIRSDLENLIEHLIATGHPCRQLMRSGNEAQMLSKIVEEEQPDLLFIGAYGHGSQVRETLGSTAERLLRSVSCPVLTYGPKLTKALFHTKRPPISILVPIELPCAPHSLDFAVGIARLFRAKLEILHVVDMDRMLSLPHAYQDVQYTCEQIVGHLREGTTQVAGSLVFGKPAEAILARSRELNSSLILIPLDTRPHLSAKNSDNVAANVIRRADVPVMTYRFDQ